MRKKKGRWLSFLFIMLLIPGLLACGKQKEPEDGDPYMYSLNEDQTGIVKRPYPIGGEDTKSQVESILKGLETPSDEIEYTDVFPDNVKIREWNVQDSIVYVDFNAAYLEMETVHEKLVRSALVQSLLQADQVAGVWISVEENALKETDGKVVGILNEDDFVENTGSSLNSYQTTTLKLYFANESGSKLVEQTVEAKYNSNLSIEKLIVEKVMQGPKKSGAYPTLNPDATLLGATIKNGICYVNFDSEFLDSAYDVKPEVAVYSLVNSLIEGTPASKVQITINGEKNAKYMEMIDLFQPLQRNMDLVEEKK